MEINLVVGGKLVTIHTDCLGRRMSAAGLKIGVQNRVKGILTSGEENFMQIIKESPGIGPRTYQKVKQALQDCVDASRRQSEIKPEAKEIISKKSFTERLSDRLQHRVDPRLYHQVEGGIVRLQYNRELYHLEMSSCQAILGGIAKAARAAGLEAWFVSGWLCMRAQQPAAK